MIRLDHRHEYRGGERGVMDESKRTIRGAGDGIHPALVTLRAAGS